MSRHEQALWNSMLSQSFSPRQWFDERDWDEDTHYCEGKIMWVYRRIADAGSRFAVGYYSPDGQWNQDSCHDSQDDAVRRVHFLNGGNQ